MTENFFTTSDGVKLHYRVGGAGKPLVMLIGMNENIKGSRLEILDGGHEMFRESAERFNELVVEFLSKD